MPDLDTLLASSMTALLNNSETRAAIVDYIQTLTNKNKPTEQWREVYWIQSDDNRYQKESYAKRLGMPEHPYRLIAFAYWNENDRLGRFSAFMGREEDYGKPKNIWDRSPDDYYPYSSILEDVIKADNYKEVIEYLASTWWKIAYSKWVEMTNEKDIK